MSWAQIPISSLLITSAVFVVFALDMVKSGYGQFALIPDLRPQISTLTHDVRSDLENLAGSKSEPTPKSKTQKLVNAYKRGKICHFEPTNYSNTFR
jgi:hypothetical protein